MKMRVLLTGSRAIIDTVSALEKLRDGSINNIQIGSSGFLTRQMRPPDSGRI